MQDTRRIRAENGAEYGRGVQRRGKPASAVRHSRVRLYLVLMWVLLCVNLLLLLQLRGRVRDMNENLSRAISRIAVVEQDLGIVVRENIGENGTGGAAGTFSGTTTASYVDRVGLDQVDKPKKRTYREIVNRLRELGEDNELIRQVAENVNAYPEQLLEALANNPEIADFAAHYLEQKGTVTGEGLTEDEKAQEFPLFLQWDPRWGYASYGDDSVVGLSGCGPTALSMVLYYLTGNEELTPDVIAEYSMREGYYISGTGTAWLLMEDVPPIYGVSVTQPEKNELVMRQALERGDLIICSMGPGDFTVGGHFVVVYGCTEEGFLLNDPNCVARSRQTWSYSEIGGQIKHIWVFHKGTSRVSDVIQFGVDISESH